MRFILSAWLLVAPSLVDVDAGVRAHDLTVDQQPARPRRPRPEVDPRVVTDVPAPRPQSPSAQPVIAEDGYVERAMEDGSTRRGRPGNCGWTTVRPDGSQSTMACAQVPMATPPLPTGASAQWLEAHSEKLLDVARTLLGEQSASIDNYLKAVESEPLNVYDRIRLRTDLINKLLGGM